jgi:hypothetical protein
VVATGKSSIDAAALATQHADLHGLRSRTSVDNGEVMSRFSKKLLSISSAQTGIVLAAYAAGWVIAAVILVAVSA